MEGGQVTILIRFLQGWSAEMRCADCTKVKSISSPPTACGHIRLCAFRTSKAQPPKTKLGPWSNNREASIVSVAGPSRVTQAAASLTKAGPHPESSDPEKESGHWKYFFEETSYFSSSHPCRPRCWQLYDSASA